MNNLPLREIDEGEIEAFARDGAVCLRGQFDGDWIRLLAAGFERIKANPSAHAVDHAPEEGRGRFVTDLAMAQRDAAFESFARTSPAGPIVARLMRSETASFFFDTMWIKEPGVEKPTNWHQDQPYFTIDGEQTCTMWLPLDPIHRDVSLQFVRGSHRWGHWFDPTSSTDGTTYYKDSPYTPMPDIEAERDKHEILAWDMAPGDCLVFHGLTVHGAAGNPSRTRRRRALASNWAGDDATYGARPGYARPRFEGHGLAPGDPMACEMFPRVWPRGGEHIGASDRRAQ